MEFKSGYQTMYDLNTGLKAMYLDPFTYCGLNIGLKVQYSGHLIPDFFSGY